MNTMCEETDADSRRILVSGLPMDAGLVGLGRLSRAMSMEDADRPRRTSGLVSSPPPAIGSPSKFAL